MAWVRQLEIPICLGVDVVDPAYHEPRNQSVDAKWEGKCHHIKLRPPGLPGG